MESKQLKDNFPNPQMISLGELQFKVVSHDGVTRNFSALNLHWAPRNQFAKYICLLTHDGRLKGGAALEKWNNKANLFHDDMEYLLAARHHEFWSYMVHRKSALTALVSFLQRATPYYMTDIVTTTNDVRAVQALKLYGVLLNLVLRIICRLVTCKESPTSWIKKEHLKKFLYTNYLLTVPMLVQLLVAVGDSEPKNFNLLNKIYSTLLQIEPKYEQDLLDGLVYFKTAFSRTQIQVENIANNGNSIDAAAAISNGVAHGQSELTLYSDAALYTLDCAATLNLLLAVCPQLLQHCDRIKLAQNTANFYNNTIPVLYKNIHMMNELDGGLNWLNQARLQLLSAFRTIIYHHIQCALDSNNETGRREAARKYFELLTECLSSETFVVDYECQYPVQLDVDILAQTCGDLTDFKVDFIVSGYRRDVYPAAGASAIRAQNSSTSSESKTATTTAAAAVKENPKSAAGKNQIKRDIDLEVIAVLDILPHLGNGFIRRLLTRYDNSEQAITAILDGNLPPDLINADQSEKYIPPDEQDKFYLKTGIRHYNIYDGDQFDVMTQDEPKCIIKQGKGFPYDPKTAEQLLDDKKDLAQLKDRYQAYSLVDDHDKYEDEYDDSYEAMLDGESQMKHKKTFNGKLADVEDVSSTEQDSDTGSSVRSGEIDQRKDASGRDKRNDFCENPEVVRACREAKWTSKHRNNAASHNVVGAPKGKGQDKETQRNRNKKEANKASRANHNRKAGAAFKRSKGMMP